MRPDLLTAVAFLTKRVQNPQKNDNEKLERTIQYLRGTKDLGLKLEVDDPMLFPQAMLPWIFATMGRN